MRGIGFDSVAVGTERLLKLYAGSADQFLYRRSSRHVSPAAFERCDQNHARRFQGSGWGPCSKLSPKEVFCMPGTWSDVITREEFDNDRAKVFSKNDPNPGS